VCAPQGYDAARVVGSNAQVHRLEHAAVGWREGPGYDCHRSDAGPWAQHAFDNPPARQRWPHYTPRALSLGYSHVVALPLREHTGTGGAPTGGAPTGGALILLSCAQRAFAPGTLTLGRSLVDFTTVVLEGAREAERSRTYAAQLQQALNSRIVIEQAKGVLVTRRTVTPDEAFDLLRKHARARRRPVRDVAREVVEGHADPELTDPVP
jgi:hypothetical protein